MLKRLFRRLRLMGRRAVAATTPVRLSNQDYVAILMSAGVRVEPVRYGGAWRCGACHQMQHSDAMRAWIPDGTLRGDPLWSVLERCRRWTYNGHFTAWCLTCCRGLKPMTAAEMAKYDDTPHDPIPVIHLQVSRGDE